MTASAEFTINGAATPPEAAVSASSTVTLALTSVSGVRTIAWSFEGNSDDSLTNPTITPAGSPLGATATFPMPAGAGQGYLLQCVINGGRDDEHVVQATYTKRAIVGVVDATTTIPFVAGEIFERDAVYGYTMTLNTRATSGGTPTITNDSVTFAKMQNIATDSLIGRDTAATGDPETITLGSSLAMNGSQVLGVATAGVTLAMMANVATARFIGRVTAATGVPEALTGTQATTLLDVGTSALKGLAPASGGGTTNFLRADWTWAAPAASLTAPTNPTDDAKIVYASAGNLAYASAIKTNGTYLAFGSTVAASGTQRFGAGSTGAPVTIAAGLDSTGVTDVALLSWGLFTNNQLTLGEATSVARISIRSLTDMVISVAGTTAFLLTNKALTLAYAAASSGTAPVILSVTGAAHTGLTASTEARDINIVLARTVTMSTGALTTQRAMRITPPTYAFVGASVITRAATLAISAAPAAGTNATITNTMALWLEAGALGFGSAPTTSGLIRTEANAGVIVSYASGTAAARSALAMTVSGGRDRVHLGDSDGSDGTQDLFLSTREYAYVRIVSTNEWTFSATTLDCNSNTITNVAQLSGTFFTNEIDDGNSSTADTIDWSTGPVHKSTLTGNCTYTFTAPAQHKWVQLKMVQDGTGSRTVTWPGAVKWSGGAQPSWVTTASAVNIATFYYDGTTYWGTGATGFA